MGPYFEKAGLEIDAFAHRNHEWWGAGMVICLERGADLHMAQLMMGCWHGYLSGARCRLAYGPADATATHCLLLQ